MDKSTYLKLIEDGYTHIPVYQEIIADLISPLYVYSNFQNMENTVLFESAKTDEKKGRYSIMSLPTSKRYDFYKNELVISNKLEKSKEKVPNAYEYIKKLTQKFHAPDLEGMPSFLGGLVGYFAYESFEHIEPHFNFSASDKPLISLLYCDEIIVFDNFKGSFYIVVTSTNLSEEGFNKASKRISEVENAIYSLQPSIKHKITKTDKEVKYKSNVDKSSYLKQIEKIKKLINSGEIMQAVLSKDVTFEGDFDPFTLYRALRLINPSPYMFYMNFPEFRIIGSSPEILVQNQNNKVTIRPIAGTRKRGKDASEDLKNKIDLIEDVKEKSEHMMLVDLARNDLSKVCNPGSVQVDEMMIVEKYSHVMHMTSNVIGEKKESVSSVDCMTDALPAGTLSGAPKIRAMEILHEIENRNRGIYGGSVGYFGFNGSLDTAIVIRTALHTDKSLTVGVGGGIVHDSIPENEWNETEAKLAVFLEALKYE